MMVLVDAIATITVSEDFTKQPSCSPTDKTPAQKPDANPSATTAANRMRPRPSSVLARQTSDMPSAACDQKALSPFSSEQQQQQQRKSAAPIVQKLAWRLKGSLLLVWHGLDLRSLASGPDPGSRWTCSSSVLKTRPIDDQAPCLPAMLQLLSGRRVHPSGSLPNRSADKHG